MSVGTAGGGPAVRVRGLVRDFGDVRAVDHLDLDVGHGRIVALLGHNGAGKTTTLRHLTGVLAPTAGTVEVFGADPLTEGVAVRRRVGVLPAGAGVDDGLTGRQNLDVVGDLWGIDRASARDRGQRLLADFGLADVAGARAGTYSTGMRQRLALARVLLHEPDLLLLDEPTAALDPMAARQVRQVIATAAGQGRTVLLCTHNLDEAQQLCDRVVVLERGRVLAEGAPGGLVTELGVAGLVLDIADGDRARARRLLAARGHRVTDARDGMAVEGIGRAQAPELLAALVGAGVRVHAAVPRAASLEDVYVRLHRRTL